MRIALERGVYAASMSDCQKFTKRHECRAPQHDFGLEVKA